MRVPPQSRIWYSPTLVATDSHGQPVEVPPTGWEASFDGGTTWLPARDNAGVPGWLIAGAGYPGPGDDDHSIPSDHTMTATVRAWIRLRDTPETIINDELWLTL